MGGNEVLNYVTLLSTIETSSCFHMATESKVKISASGAKASFLCEHYGLWCVPWDIFGLFVVFSMAGPITPPVGYLFILGFISFFLFLISILLVFLDIPFHKLPSLVYFHICLQMQGRNLCRCLASIPSYELSSSHQRLSVHQSS